MNRLPHPRSGRGEAGAALLLTLGILALLVLLVVSFLSVAGMENRSSHGYAEGQKVRRLADSAVHVVLSQIREATEGFEKGPTGSLDPDSPLAWASQPGMIHTYDDAGNPDRIFKLYSSEQMIETATSAAPPDEVTALADWETRPGIYTDLNSPVLVRGPSSDLVPLAPIIEVADLVDGSTLSPAVAGMTYSSDGTKPDIEGFAVTPPASYDPSGSISPSNNPIPMPVRWLYVLEDGQLTVPRYDAGTRTAVFDLAGQAVPTRENPIVSRIAFWTDDECAKVNVNTASEGVYWDVPRTYSLEDVGQYDGTNPIPAVPGMSLCQPAQKEFQRYPGHPATTSLSPILGTVLPLPSSLTSASATGYENYYPLTPRTHVSELGKAGSRAGTQIATAILPIKSDRLFPSVDEFLFSTGFGATGRETNGPLVPDLLRRSRFFLSAHSISPETTLYNTPRIAIWPVWEDEGTRTAYDQLAAFCSTIGGEAYHFTRSNPRSGTADYTTRNRALYEWLQRLTSEEVPGYGGDFETKFGVDRDQILTLIYDYIRCINLQDRSDGATPYTRLYTGGGSAPVGAGEVVPIRIGSTQGFGRFPTLSSPGLLFAGKAGAAARATSMECVLTPEFFSPGHGLACLRPNAKFRIRGLDKLRIRFQGQPWMSLNLPPDGTCVLDGNDMQHWGGRAVGGTTGLCPVFRGKPLTTSGAHIARNYPFFSSLPIAVPPDPSITTFEFDGQGAEIVLEMLANDTGELVQTCRFVFPNGEFLIPGFNRPVTNRSVGTPASYPYPQDTLVALEVAGIAGNDPAPALDPTAGDVRMVSGLIDVPSSYYRAHQDYQTKGVRFAHSYKTSSGRNRGAGLLVHGTSQGKLVPVSSYDCPGYPTGGYDRNPDVPTRVGNGVVRIDGAPGEWDTGVGDQPDGPYINKPNEGDTALYQQVAGHLRAPYLLGAGRGFASAVQIFFSPNLQVPSSLMFGSIPTGVRRFRPWETLLFHPRPEDPNHPGRSGPHDHLLADLFWMPVIEPYAISQPFATSGKINLNQRIQPFDYIRRRTGLHAVLKATRFLGLENVDSIHYKPLDPSWKPWLPFAPNRRFPIDSETTVDEFDSRYQTQGLFRSPGEICEMHLLPPGVPASGIRAFWEARQLSGDNVREKPYVDLYPRVTTRSNAFTIHYKVQTLRQTRNSPPNVWNEAKDSVVGEQRGSTIIERHIDPTDPRIPDFATVSSGSTDLVMDRYYRFRVLSSKIFKP